MSPITVSLAAICLVGFAQLAISDNSFYRHSRGRDLDLVADGAEDRYHYEPADLQPAASGYHGHGRVHIKVYRGPSDGHHASHGYWVKQPADD